MVTSTHMVLARKQTIWLFTGLMATIYVAVFFLARTAPALTHPGRMGLGATFDLVITVPALYYLLLIRPGFSSWTALMAVVLVGARAAGFLLTSEELQYVPALKWIALPLELWAIAAVVRRIRRANRTGDVS